MAKPARRLRNCLSGSVLSAPHRSDRKITIRMAHSSADVIVFSYRQYMLQRVEMQTSPEVRPGLFKTERLYSPFGI